MHDTFLAADYSHPGDNIPPILAVAQTMGKSGRDLIRGIATGYEIHIDLVRAICLHKHKIDHIAHLCPAQAAGIGTLLGLKQEVIYQAVQQAVHVSCTTRQSRKGEISSWKAYAPAHAGKLAVEAVDRVMRGEGAPSPIYEGEDSVIAWMLDGPQAHYQVPLPAPGEPKRAILDSFTKEHSAEYQSQALIDLAFRMREQIPDLEKIEKIIIHTSHHTHAVIGTGANDPQKMDPKASRETLDHSIMYIFAVALQDGRWHHVDSYAPRRAGRADTVRLWHKIETREDPEWERRYLSTDPAEQAFGGRVEVLMQDGSRIVDELAVANAHPLGAKPFGRDDYIRKFTDADRRRDLDARGEPLPGGRAGSAAAEGGRAAHVERRPARRHACRRQAGDLLSTAPVMAGAWPRHPRHSRTDRDVDDAAQARHDRAKEHTMSDTAALPNRAKKGVGLSGVTAGNTALCTVGRTGNDLHYRGYDILDVAETLRVRGDRLPAGARQAADARRARRLQGQAARRCAACRHRCKQALEALPRRDASDGRDAHRRLGARLRAAREGRPRTSRARATSPTG